MSSAPIAPSHSKDPLSPGERGRGEGRRKALLALGLLILTLAVFGQTLTHQFVFDDLGLVVRNELVQNLHRLPALLSADYWSFTGKKSGLYRPLVLLSFSVEHAFYGLRPLGYHAVNLLLHAAVSLLVFLVVDALFGHRSLALATALLFNLHPVHVEAIAPVAGRSELLAAVLFFLAWWCHLRVAQAPAARAKFWTLSSHLSFFAALLSKESAVLLPAALVLGDALRFAPETGLPELGRRVWTAVRWGWKRYAAYAAPLLAALALRTHALGAPLKPADMAIGFVENPLIAAGAGARLWTGFKLTGLYLLKLLIPLRLSSDYYFDQIPLAFSSLDPTVIASFLGLAALLTAAIWWRRRAACLGLAFMALTLLPYTQWPFITGSLFAERFLYLPSFGFCLALAAALDSKTAVLRAGLVLLLACYAAMAGAATRVWRDNLSLFGHAAEVAPRSATAHLNYGLELIEAGRDRAGAGELQRALEIYARIGPAHVALGDAYLRLGLFERAEGSYRRGLREGADPAVTFTQLGLLAQKRGKFQVAEDCFRRALARDSKAEQARLRLADLLIDRGFAALQNGQSRRAESALEEASRLDPKSWRAWEGRGMLLEQTGRLREAEFAYQKLLALNPKYARAHVHLAGIYVAQNRLGPAERELREAIDQDPALPDAHYGLALVLARGGEATTALEQLETVISLSPKFKPAYEAAIQILESLPVTETTRREIQKLRQQVTSLFTSEKGMG